MVQTNQIIIFHRRRRTLVWSLLLLSSDLRLVRLFLCHLPRDPCVQHGSNPCFRTATRWPLQSFHCAANGSARWTKCRRTTYSTVHGLGWPARPLASYCALCLQLSPQRTACSKMSSRSCRPTYAAPLPSPCIFSDGATMALPVRAFTLSPIHLLHALSGLAHVEEEAEG